MSQALSDQFAIVVPVKDLNHAKTRLDPLLSRQERIKLAEIMLDGVLSVIATFNQGFRLFMVSSYQPAMMRAREYGFEIIEEKEQTSERASIDAASKELEQMGFTGVLRIPLDLPLLNGDALGEMIQPIKTGARVVIAPSRDGTGTNGLYRSPPTLFPSRFGENSLAQHLELARSKTDAIEMIKSEAFGLDIDDADDLRALLETGKDCPSSRFLKEIEIQGRILQKKP